MKIIAGILRVNLIFVFAVLLCEITLCTKVYANDKVVVVIDPGHGGRETANELTYGNKYKDNLYEKEINVVTAIALKQELEKYNNTEVYITRTEDVSMGLSERVAYAQSVNADVMVSCHYNSSTENLFYGGEVITSAYGNCYMTGNGIAQCIEKQWRNASLAFRGIKTKLNESGADYEGIIRYGTEIGLPVIVLEHGFLDNPNDYAKLGTRDDWQRMGRLDAAGIAEYYGLSKETTLDEVVPTITVPSPDFRIEPDVTEPTGVSIEIVDTNAETSEITYEVSAIEPNGQLMYFGLALVYDADVNEFADEAPEDEASDDNGADATEIVEVGDADFDELLLWEEGKTTMSGTYSVPPSFRGYVVARVYNLYELYSEAEPVELDMATLREEFEMESDDEEVVFVPNGGAQMIYPHGGTPASDPRVVDSENTFSLGGTKVKDKDKVNNTVLGTRNKALFGLVVVCSIVAVVLIIILIVVSMNVIVPWIRRRRR